MRKNSLWKAALLLWITLSVMSCCPGLAEEEMTVSGPDTLKCHTAGTFKVNAPCAGVLKVEIRSKLNPVLMTEETVSAGENKYVWDGLGAFGEPMEKGEYTMRFSLKAEKTENAENEIYETVKTVRLTGRKCALLYALPDGTGVCPGYENRKLGIEYRLTAPGTFVMELYRDGERVCTLRKDSEGDDHEIYSWNGKMKNGEDLPAGLYTARCYAEGNEQYSVSFSLTVKEKEDDPIPLAPTGDIMPRDGMSDMELWELMQQPSAVLVDNSNIHAAPEDHAKVIAHFVIQTQAVEVLEVRDDGWCRVRANDEKSLTVAEGYTRRENLKMVVPSAEYGILVDKSAQSLTLYRYGEPVARIPVSTGSPDCETVPGSFFVSRHEGTRFPSEGAWYEYPLRFCHGYIIHSTGFKYTDDGKDYSKNLPLLGAKASHGCVRVSPFTDEEGSVNMYWLWTHIPFRTRVIITE